MKKTVPGQNDLFDRQLDEQLKKIDKNTQFFKSRMKKLFAMYVTPYKRLFALISWIVMW